MTKRIVINAAAISVTCSLLWGPVSTAAASTTSGPPLAASAPTSQSTAAAGWGASDWRDLAQRARAAGDPDGAAVSVLMAERAEAEGRRSPADARNIWTTIAKKAVIQALRYGADKLPAKIRPYVAKIIDVVEEIDQFQQGAVVLALTKAGVPYDVAVTAAQWIVVFIGL
jgi:hypothetical protein